ncbi:MAG TPA: methionine--tRNA ligase, partial [Firmicutes bacterium]|nr:methionine--tRNA ligase [Bacillota bacterium]
MKNILIGGAWPYANGSLHIGHIAALLPGDIIARYHRAIGNRVFYVSGSDCHGTPVAIRAKQEGKTPGAVSDFYHAQFVDVFNKLGFSYDLYTKTSDRLHIKYVQEFHRKLYEGGYIHERTVKQAFCQSCN